MSEIFVKSVSCCAFQLRSDPSKHFAYEIHVKWSNGQSAVIYRRYSQFFNLQCKLLDTFPLEAGTYDPSKRTLPFLPGKRFTKNFSEKTAEKRRLKFDIYLKALIELTNVGNCSLVNNFFESKESDLTSLLERKNSKSSQSSMKLAPTGHVISGPLSLPQYMVLEDYKKVQKGELSITVGSIVFVVEKKHTGWWLAQSQDDDAQGWVPAAFLEPVYGTESSDEDEFSTLPSEPERFVSTSDYDSTQADEISALRGTIIEVLKKNMDGWWLCRCEGKQGMFPSAYLKKANTLKAKELMAMSKQKSTKLKTPPSITRKLSKYAPPRRDGNKNKPPRPAAPPMQRKSSIEYRAIADFAKSMDDGVDLREGASVKVVTRDDSGWWYVEVDKIKGWAPSTYIEQVTTEVTIPAVPRSNNIDISSKKATPPARPARPPSARSSPAMSRKSNITSVTNRLSTNQSRLQTGPDKSARDPFKPPKPAPPSSALLKSRSSIGAHSSPPLQRHGATQQGAHIKPKPLKPPLPTNKPSLINNNSVVEPDSDDTQQLSVSELRKRLASNLKT